MRVLPLVLLCGAIAAGVTPAMAGSLLLTPDPLDEAFFGFGGAMMNDVFNPFGGFEPNTLVGAGYQRFWGNPDGLQYGVEVGVAGRFGQRNSVEGWSGAAARYTFGLGPINVGLGFTFGLSAVTDTVVGQESESEAFHQGDATVLFYMGPEVSAALAYHEEFEVFVRLHHRSGAWGTLGNMAAGADAAVAGLRYRF